MRFGKHAGVTFRSLALMMEAVWLLFKADALAKAGYPALRRQMSVRIKAVGRPCTQEGIAAIATAVNRASRYYPKSPACLQRSVALASMLRKRGIAAELQIGVQNYPFKSHAWVEVAGKVINDVPHIREVFPPLHEFKG